MKLDLTLNELNIILNSLGRMPYESVFELIAKIQIQGQQQLDEKNKTQEQN